MNPALVGKRQDARVESKAILIAHIMLTGDFFFFFYFSLFPSLFLSGDVTRVMCPSSFPALFFSLPLFLPRALLPVGSNIQSWI